MRIAFEPVRHPAPARTPPSSSTPSSTPSVTSPTADVTRAAAPSIDRYDFGSITPRQLLDQVNHLIRTGQMDLDDSSAIVGLMPMEVDGRAFNGGTAAWDRPIDVFARLADGQAYAASNDDDDGVRFFGRAIAAIERFQGRPVSFDVTA